MLQRDGAYARGSSEDAEDARMRLRRSGRKHATDSKRVRLRLRAAAAPCAWRGTGGSAVKGQPRVHRTAAAAQCMHTSSILLPCESFPEG